MKKKILLYGIGTFKNKGVEAIIQSTLNQINEKKYEINAATHDYEYNNKFYNNMIKKYIKHYKKSNELTKDETKQEKYYKSIEFDYNNFELLYQKDVVNEIKDSDICISVGGDNYCYDFCTWLYSLDKKSHDLGKKTILWGASLFEELQDPELINNLKNFDLIVVRESLSYNAIKKYIPDNKILFRPDPAFSLVPKKTKLNKWYEEKKFIIINVSPLTIVDEEKYSEVLNLINYILKETKYNICLLPHVITEDCNDLEILEKIKEEYLNDKRVYLETANYNCNELKYIISKSEILVASRTHASIAAYSMKIPTLVIGYSVKSRGIAKDIFNNIDDYVISKDDLRNGKLTDKFKYINENKIYIKELLSKKMPEYKEKAKNIWKEVEEKLQLQDNLKICTKENCIGCGVCASMCPKKAITMEKDENGYIYPKIDLKKCIHCNICRINCPIINKEIKKESYENKYYAAKNKDLDIKLKSSSGGVFSLFAKTVLRNKGIVYGCEMKEFKANHIRISNENDLYKILGSKYIQSNIENCYKQIKNDLNSNKMVLFSGTPCQVAAIKKYLGTEYENLLTISVICHGVLNDTFLDKQIKNLEKEYNDKILNINFRSKKNSWKDASIEYIFKNKSIIRRFTEDEMMELFLKDIVMRESCYNCAYKGKNNVADIILGDYWGIEVTNKEFYDKNGVSAVIINTKKGEEFINNYKLNENVDYTIGNYQDILKYNPALEKSISKSKFYPIALEIIRNKEFNIASLEIIKMLQQDELNRLRNYKIQLDNIKNSKRWNYVEKLSNTINKLLRRK